VNRNQFEINTETRRLDIINYIIDHQGCTKADLERGLSELVSKTTIYKLVKRMVDEGVLIEQKHDMKSIRLLVNKNNLLASVPIELEQFKSAFATLFDKTNEKITFPSIFGTSSDTASNRILELSEERLSLFLRMVDSILIRSIVKWPKRIQDKETLKKLYYTVFVKISDILIDIAEHHEIPSFLLESTIEKLAIKKLKGGGSLFRYWQNFKKYGIQTEIDNVIDALWNIDKEIQEMVYKDLPHISKNVGLNFQYGSNNWRGLFEALSSLDSQNVK
jgi:hypothetical protein